MAIAACSQPAVTAERARPPVAAQVLALTRDGVGPGPYHAGLAISADGAIRFECPRTILDRARHAQPVVKQDSLSPERVRATLEALDRRGVFGSDLPAEEGVEGADCGTMLLAVTWGSRSAHLQHHGCAKPTSIYVDAMRIVQGLVAEAPCDLRCELFGVECAG
ncbi:MAG: hypothetical protein ACM31C_25485 [Acidobacteriota bacterium]